MCDIIALVVNPHLKAKAVCVHLLIAGFFVVLNLSLITVLINLFQIKGVSSEDYSLRFYGLKQMSRTLYILYILLWKYKPFKQSTVIAKNVLSRFRSVTACINV